MADSMPIYLVRWPDLSASLVRAADEEHLVDILDQVANPEGCEWVVYDGPLAIDFRLPARWSVREGRAGAPVAPEQVVIEDVGVMVQAHVAEAMEVRLAEGDEGHDTGEAILQQAFPRLQAAIDEFRESDAAEEQDYILPEADLRKALHAELARMLTASWKRAQLERSTDPIARFAREVDLPVELARKYTEIAVGKREHDDDDDPETGA